MRNSIKALLAFSFAALSMGGQCATPQNLVISFRTTDDLFISYIINHLSDRLSTEFTMKFKLLDANNDEKTQLKQLGENICGDDTLLIIDTVTPGIADKVLGLCKEHGTGVIFINQPPARDLIENYDKAWFLGSQSSQAGELQGQMITDYLKSHDYDVNHNGELDIALFRGPDNHQDAINRTQKVMEAVDKAGVKYNVRYECKCHWSFDEAKAFMSNVLEGNGYGDIDMIISNNDDMALGAVNAIERSEAFKKDQLMYLPVFGVDAVPEALARIKYGSMTGTVQQNYTLLGDLSYALTTGISDFAELSKIADGLPITSRYIEVPYTPYTRGHHAK